jgi:hypothetical protein
MTDWPNTWGLAANVNRGIRQRLQGQTPDHHEERRAERGNRVPDPEGQTHLGSGGRLCPPGRLAGRWASVPHDILKAMGVETLSDHLVNEIQDVYRLRVVAAGRDQRTLWNENARLTDTAAE